MHSSESLSLLLLPEKLTLQFWAEHLRGVVYSSGGVVLGQIDLEHLQLAPLDGFSMDVCLRRPRLIRFSLGDANRT